MSHWEHTDPRFGPIDPAQAAFYDAKIGGALPDPLEPVALRNLYLKGAKIGEEQLKSVEDKKIPGPRGDIPIRMYVPETEASKPLPVLVYFHGGCWFLNPGLAPHDAFLRRLANVGKFILLAVDYRLAPENPFPAGLEDCYTATKWAAENGSSFGGDRSKVAVGGDSCGGNLSAAVAILVKERKEFKLAMQLLLYPMCDHYSAETQSLNTMAKLPSYDRRINDLGWDIYGACSSPHGSKDNPDYHAAVLRAPDVTGLAPAHFAIAQLDIIYDEAVAYAQRLKEAGNQVSVIEYEGSVHGFMAASVTSGKQGITIAKGPPAIQETVDILNKAFAAA